MVDRQKAFSFFFSRDFYQRFSPSQISDTPQAGVEPALNQSWIKLRSSDANYTTAPLSPVEYLNQE